MNRCRTNVPRKPSGVSYGVLAGVGTAYLLTALAYAGLARRRIIDVTATDLLRSGDQAA